MIYYEIIFISVVDR